VRFVKSNKKSVTFAQISIKSKVFKRKADDRKEGDRTPRRESKPPFKGRILNEAAANEPNGNGTTVTPNKL